MTDFFRKRSRLCLRRVGKW